MITAGQAIERLAENTYENKQRWKQALKQRRTEYTDIYGIPMVSELNSNTAFEYHVAISTDLEYYERFQFKLFVKANGSIDPDGFTFAIGRPGTAGDPDDTRDLVDISAYLEEQTGEWVDGSGYFPEEDIGTDVSGSFYDVLDAVGMIMAEDRDQEDKEDDMNAILNPGNKIVRIESDTPCEVMFIPYIKYSTVNR